MASTRTGYSRWPQSHHKDTRFPTCFSKRGSVASILPEFGLLMTDNMRLCSYLPASTTSTFSSSQISLCSIEYFVSLVDFMKRSVFAVARFCGLGSEKAPHLADHELGEQLPDIGGKS
eukprot:TRINITY_DN4638_c0_g1_i1.p1 TRINITY_DN4638_c0_g1~~TRINITY_DN4638_c0_g1_i1.p1  ORF type:complete len:118 (-),score=0.66 TRINITY_DN4638_c0_g1_i1:357-710(-)